MNEEAHDAFLRMGFFFLIFLLTDTETDIIVINVVTTKDYFRKTICEKVVDLKRIDVIE